jgi:penicillin amidase
MSFRATNRGVNAMLDSAAPRFAPLRLCVSLLFLSPTLLPAAERATLHVRETAGIRRFGYPVAAELKLDPPAPAATKFRLLQNGKPVIAQFRPVMLDGERLAVVAVDFDGNFMPRESRGYVVEFGPDVAPPAEPDRGMKVDDADDSFIVSHGPNLKWTVPKNLFGLFRSVKTPKWDYVQPDSGGLTIHGADDTRFRIGDVGLGGAQVIGRVVKQGPIDCAVRFESTDDERRTHGFVTDVELEFPRSKSWVRVTWSVDDPKAIVTGLSADLNLNVSAGPTLVDFGVGGSVYAAIAPGQVAMMEVGSTAKDEFTESRGPRPFWGTFRGPRGKLEPYVVGPLHDPTLLEGWVHVMDRERCSAIALDAIGDRCLDRVEVESEGRVKISRDFATSRKDALPESGRKQLKFWWHVVPFPPHVGAVTSPQSMQSPLEVTWAAAGRAATTPNRERERPADNQEKLERQVTDLKARATAALAQTSGELRVAGLQDKVEVLRDKWGVPHIYARNQRDLFFAQGFVQAQDRLWQMELWRRTTEGRLAEIVGPAAVERDRIARLVRYRGDMAAEWASYSPDAREIIESFVRGVNACIELVRDNPAIEFRLTGTQPEPWTPEVCVGRMAGLIMCRNASSEVLRAQLVRELGAEQAAMLLPTDPPQPLRVPDGLDLDGIDGKVTAALTAAGGSIRVPLLGTPHPNPLPRGEREKETGRPGRAAGTHAASTGTHAASIGTHVASSQLLRHSELSSPSPLWGEGWGEGFAADAPDPIHLLDLAPESIGSNNWTIAGRHTDTGKPILANDPHRPITLPALRYIVHLNCPPMSSDRGWNVIGGTEPALPGVAIGHNDRIGWGMTIVGTDQMDLYVEETNRDDANRYRVGAEWQPLRVERDQIRVRGEAAPRTVELKFSRHGPVIHEDRERCRAYALRWTGSEPGTAGYLGALALDRATNWNEFLAAAARWKLPSENLVYADVDGHIGWIAAALTPVRRGWDGLLPVPGADGKFEWAGFLPTAELPQRFDPAEGYIATANHNILPPGYARVLGFEWAAPFRFQRVDEVLRGRVQAGEKLTVADSQRLQHDATSIPARRLIAVLRETKIDDPSLRTSVELLSRWNMVTSRDSPAAALYEVWQRNLSERVLKSRLPDQLWERYSTRLPLDALVQLVERPDSAFGSDPRAGRDAALADSLSAAVADVTRRLGPDTTAWRWGTLHQAHFRHMLGDAERGTSGVERRGQQDSPAADNPLRAAIAASFNLASVPRDGDGFTPLAAGGSGVTNYDQTTGSSFRHVLDLADWDRSVATSVPGQSGQPLSPHYGDLLALWGEGQYFPLPFSRAAVEAATAEVLTLLPGR